MVPVLVMCIAVFTVNLGLHLAAIVGVLQEPPPRWPLARGNGRVALGQTVHERGEVEASVALNLDVEIEPVDLHIRECPRPA